MTTKAVAALLPLLALAGCAAGRAREDVSALVEAGTGAVMPASEGDASASVPAALREGLTEESAVRIALLNNRAILASLEEVGVARAELAQARILGNPEFTGGSGFYAGRSGTFPHFTLTQDVLDLVLYPLRRKEGAERFEAARLSVGRLILETTTRVREAFYAFLAAEQIEAAAKAELSAAEALAEFARRQGAAGNLNELNLAKLEAAQEEAQITWESRAADAAVARAELAESLGLESDAEGLKAGQAFAEPAGAEPPAADLETLALSRRLDVAAARRTVAALEKSVSLSRWQVVPEIRLGIERETEADARRTGPELELQIPLFDRGQARRAGARARLRRARQELAMLEVRARKEVRAARVKTAAARKAAVVYRERLVPLRGKIVAQTQLHYNFMLLGVDHLLEAKREELRAQGARVEALKAYWTERARLELAAGGPVAIISHGGRP